MSMADIICIAFFFLLRPGEYTGTVNNDATFTLNDVYLCLVVKRKLSLESATDSESRAALFILRLQEEPSEGRCACTIMLS